MKNKSIPNTTFYFISWLINDCLETNLYYSIMQGTRLIAEKARLMVKKWAESECASDASLSLVSSLYTRLKEDGYSFESSEPKKSAPIVTDPYAVGFILRVNVCKNRTMQKRCGTWVRRFGWFSDILCSFGRWFLLYTSFFVKMPQDRVMQLFSFLPRAKFKWS